MLCKPRAQVCAKPIETPAQFATATGKPDLPRVRILLVDDHAAMRRRVRDLLQARPDWTICGEAADGAEAVEKALELRPDAALHWYVKGVEERSGISISLDVPDNPDRFTREAELVVFIAVSGDAISVQVTDHGKGMPPEKLAKVRSNASGVGIRGMRERVRQLGGQMNIDSGESGTTVSVTLPAALIVSESSPLGTKQTENVSRCEMHSN
jgi:hypothetical protein